MEKQQCEDVSPIKMLIFQPDMFFFGECSL